MKLHTLTAILLFVFAGCTSTPPADYQSCCGEGRVPSAETEKEPSTILTHDFGLVEQNQLLQHTFTIKNPSDTDIRFKRDPDIGFPCCVELEVTSEIVPAGRSVDVNVSFQTRQRPGPFDVFIRLFPDSKEVPAHIHVGGVVRKA